jgi:hypothetical protein
MVSLNVPKNIDFSDSDNAVTRLRKSFEKAIAGLEENGVINPKKISVYEFYSKIEFFSKKVSN